MTKKKKIGRPRSDMPMVHTAVVLPADLIAELKAEAKKSGHGMSAEIRDRLRTASLKQMLRGDPKTADLLHAIEHLSDFLARDFGKRWHQHPYVMAAFRAGVANFLERYPMVGDERVPPDAEVVGDPPDVVGRTLARRVRMAGHEAEDE